MKRLKFVTINFKQHLTLHEHDEFTQVENIGQGGFGAVVKSKWAMQEKFDYQKRGGMDEKTDNCYGLPAYMDHRCFKLPPEYDQKSDIFSFGVILWEISSGKYIWMILLLACEYPAEIWKCP
ncbi:3269_t:CDS:2 [Dentiscutata erythropus]|uniref:3269_t:CDS:1 n=1 Tax=Dentiscutata erythropus TaxID=1348616 RepID=A0A9N9P5Y8_9GLOM|nr:3269_t:CDS:2 [Dentiscutata erythropus]